MTGKRNRKIVIDTDSSSDDSIQDPLDSDAFDNSSNFQNSSNGSSVISETSKPKRRGRGPSKRPCLNRNALMARMNRQKKKEYLEKIEKKLSQYRQENKNLTNLLQKQVIDLKRLNAEVSYLRNVLNNNTTVTALLKAMNEILRRRSSNQRNFSNHDYKLRANDTAEGINCDSSTGLTSSNPSAISQEQPLISDNVDLGVTDQEIEQLAMDNNIFDNFTDNEANNDPIDFIRSSYTPALETNLFENLDNSGVCVHVNSRRISLEFCSICHLNSINSDDP